MKTFTHTAAQGDVHFTRRERLPDGVTALPSVNGRIVVTHSETGHDHVMLLDRTQPGAEPAVIMYGTDNPLVSWLQVNRATRGIIVVPMDAERLSSEKPVKPRKPKEQRAKIPARKTDWPKRPMRGRNSFQDNR